MEDDIDKKIAEKLEILKKKLVEEKEFSAIMTYFYDTFMDFPEFQDRSKPFKSELLERLIENIAEQRYQKKSTIRNVLLLQLEKHKFIHGGFTIASRIGNIIYFPEINKGLLCMATLSGGTTDFTRFSAQMVVEKPSHLKN